MFKSTIAKVFLLSLATAAIAVGDLNEEFPAIAKAINETAGPRFSESLTCENTALGIGSCLSCIPVVVKEVPCIYRAIKDKNPGELLDCGVTKADICKCLTCLPGPIKPYVQEFCSDAAFADAVPTTRLVDPEFVNSDDINIKAFLGALTQTEIDAARFHLLKSHIQGSAHGDTVVTGIFPSCGSCASCAGVCVTVPFVGDTCVGACVA